MPRHHTYAQAFRLGWALDLFFYFLFFFYLDKSSSRHQDGGRRARPLTKEWTSGGDCPSWTRLVSYIVYCVVGYKYLLGSSCTHIVPLQSLSHSLARHGFTHPFALSCAYSPGTIICWDPFSRPCFKRRRLASQAHLSSLHAWLESLWSEDFFADIPLHTESALGIQDRLWETGARVCAIGSHLPSHDLFSACTSSTRLLLGDRTAREAGRIPLISLRPSCLARTTVSPDFFWTYLETRRSWFITTRNWSPAGGED
jgi:hypothetical protein